jgi:hypothetical protein
MPIQSSRSIRYRVALPLVSLLGLLLGTIFFAAVANAQSCTYEVRGAVLVDSQFVPSSANDPLRDLEIRVSGRARFGTWNEWARTRTARDGSFEIEAPMTGSACSNGRNIRVQARFADEELRVRHEDDDPIQPPPWLTIGTRGRGDCTRCDFGNLVFDGPSDDVAQVHAEIWMIYKRVMDRLSDLQILAHIPEENGDFRFRERVDVLYPYTWSGASYVGPGSQTVHLKRQRRSNDFNRFVTMLHELAHVWAFQHSRNETLMRSYFLNPSHGFNTHGIVSESAVAFHEGFAQYFAIQMGLEEFSQSQNIRAHSHTYLTDEGVKGNHYPCSHHRSGSIDCMDEGWESILGGLSMGHHGLDLLDHEFGTTDDFVREFDPHPATPPTGCELDRPELALADVLHVFADPHDPREATDIHTDDMNLNDFLARTSEALPHFDETDAAAYSRLVDPSLELEAEDVYCASVYVPTPYVSADFEPTTVAIVPGVFSARFEGAVAVDIMNNSSVPTGGFEIRSVTGTFESLGREWIDTIEAGEQASVSFDTSVIRNSDGSFPITEYLFYLTSDPSTGSHLQVGPDLNVTAHLSIDDPIELYFGTYFPADVICTIENVGNAPMGTESTAVLFVDDRNASDVEIADLRPGERASYHERFYASEEDVLSVIETFSGSCVADPDEQLDELNDFNNGDSDPIRPENTHIRYADLLSSVEEFVEASEEFAGYQHELTEQGLNDLIEQMTLTLYLEFIEDQIIWESRGDTYDLVTDFVASPEFTDLAIPYLESTSTAIEFDRAVAVGMTRFAESYMPQY